MSESIHSHSEKGIDSLQQNIKDATEVAYNEVAPLHDIDPQQAYYSPLCEAVTDRLQTQLTEQHITSHIKEGADWEVVYHRFIGIPQEEDELIVDPTWQQFLEAPSESLTLIPVSMGLEDKILGPNLPKFPLGSIPISFSSGLARQIVASTTPTFCSFGGPLN